MKRKLLLGLGAAICFGVILLVLFTPKAPTRAPTRSRFITFTNYFGGPAARFVLTNFPGDALYSTVSSVEWQKDGIWQSVPGASGNWRAQLMNGANLENFLTVPVPTTNDPVRVVLQVMTESTGPLFRLERWLAGKGLRRNARAFIHPPSFYFTNETVVLSPAQ